MSTSSGPTAREPNEGSGASRIAYIFSAAAMPFIAVWKNDPSVRSGMKNSAASREKVRAPANVTPPFANCTSMTTMPAAAPPNANRSMTVIELSCMVSRRIVALRNPSASSFMTSWRRASAR